MNYYIDIKLLPDAELSETFLMNKVYAKLHKALHDLGSNAIGVSFPKCHVLLGSVLRLHSTEEKLKQLRSLNWLSRLTDYCDISPISEIPNNIKGHRTVSRKQRTMTMAKLKKRVEYQKANGVLKTAQEIEAYEKQYKEKMFASSLDNPYLELHSSTNHNNYRVFIEMGEIKSGPVEGTFNHFGLSKKATIPWF